jgi:LysM repeat protein
MTQPDQQKKEGGGISETLNKKWGPFPVWLYLVVVGLIIFLFIYMKRKNSGASSSTTTDTVSQSTRPPFINQVYTNTSPPEQSAPDQDNQKSPARLFELKRAETLTAIAKQFNITKDQLIRLNPDLANKYENTGKKVPKGTKIRLPRQESGGGGTLH